jgi:preprotein translocase subunit SecE
MSAFIEYLKETKGELKHVSWPTRQQTIVFTVVVILISLGVAFFLGFFDFVFLKGLSTFFR